MTERWRKPLKIAAVEPDPVGTLTIGDRRYQNANVTLADPDDMRRLYQGYVCVQCQEPHEVPFPITCSLCGFPMRAEQARRLGIADKGEKWIGPRTTNDDELAMLEEESARRRALKKRGA